MVASGKQLDGRAFLARSAQRGQSFHVGFASVKSLLFLCHLFSKYIFSLSQGKAESRGTSVHPEILF